MKLVIISHTPHFLHNGIIVGWNATLREIDQLSSLFSATVHLAPLHEEEALSSASPYNSNSIVFVPLMRAGGPGILNKLKILGSIIPNIIRIQKQCKDADIIHFRAPTSIGIYTLPLLFFHRNKKQWIKYAGNWMQQNKPWSYKFQKWWLERNFNCAQVTINGRWNKQPEHIHSFENPCLTNAEYSLAKNGIKDWKNKFTLCFAASLTPNKGALKIIQALNEFAHSSELFERIIFAGDGPEREILKSISCPIPIELKGFLNKADLFMVFQESHFVVLPSENEGFPKTIAEAMAFGCIPMVTDVSSIGQYINNDNGFLLPTNTPAALVAVFKALPTANLATMSKEAQKSASLFTYEKYLNNVRKLLKLSV